MNQRGDASIFIARQRPTRHRRAIARRAIFPARSAAPDPIGRGEAAGFSRRISGRYALRASVQNTEQSKRPTGAAISRASAPNARQSKRPTGAMISAPASPPTARHRLSDCEPSFHREGEEAIAIIFVLFLPRVDFRRESDLKAVADGVEIV